MSNSVLAATIVPIVALLALAVWLAAIYRADRRPRRAGHPEQSERAVPRREVSGGQFRSTGGRQLMPRRDQTPAEALESDELTADTGPGGRQAPPHETSPG